MVTEVLNGEYYVTFTYPKQPDDLERYEALLEDNEVRFPAAVERGQHFTIRKVDEFRRGLQIYKSVEAHHVAYNLSKYFYDDYIDFAAAQPLESMLSRLGAGTPYSFVIEGSFAPQDIFEWGEDTRVNLLQKLRDIYGAELSFDNYEITLTSRKGGNYGSEVRYRKNSAGIQRTSHSMERITRLYGYGTNGLTIEGLPGRSVKYIDSQYFDPANPYEGKIEFPEIDDQSRLLAEMQKHLATVELPKVSYEIEFVQLEKADKDFEAERIRGVGDTVTVTDEPMGYKFDARVHQFVRYPFEPRRARVTLSNFRELTTVDYIFRATVGSRKAIEYTSRNAVIKGIKYDDSITIADGFGITVSDDFNRKRVMLGQYEPGKYGLIVLNKAGGRTIGLDDDGNALFSGTLVAAAGTFTGTVQAGNIVSSSINGGSITGTMMSASSIFGGMITGTEMTGGLIQTRAAGLYPRIELNSSGNLLTASSSAGNSFAISPNRDGVPSLYFTSGGTISAYMQYLAGYGLMLNAFGGFVSITPSRQLYLSPGSGYSVYVPSWSRLVEELTGRTLQQELDGLQTAWALQASQITNLQQRVAVLES